VCVCVCVCVCVNVLSKGRLSSLVVYLCSLNAHILYIVDIITHTQKNIHIHNLHIYTL